MNAKDSANDTPLEEAAYGGYADVVKLLLDKGADQKVIDSSGMTALQEAEDQGHKDVVELLKSYGGTPANGGTTTSPSK